MHNGSRRMLAQEGANESRVADVAAHQEMPVLALQRIEIFWITGIRQQVQVNQPRFGRLQKGQDEV
jgi:hypothetical protein